MFWLAVTLCSVFAFGLGFFAGHPRGYELGYKFAIEQNNSRLKRLRSRGFEVVNE